MKRTLLMATVATLMSTTALADGFYIGGEAGYGWSRDANIDRTIDYPGDTHWGLKKAPFSFNLNDNLGSSVMGGASVGYQVNMPNAYGALRFELGTNYRPGFEYDKSFSYSSFDKKTWTYDEEPKFKSLSIEATAPVMADFSSIAFMGNVYYDAKQWSYRGKSVQVYPLVGLGLGFARNEISDIRTTVTGNKTFDASWKEEPHVKTFEQSFSMKDKSDIEFAYQAMAGVGFDFARGWSMVMMYRYVDLGSITTGSRVSTDGTFGSGEFDVDPITADLRVHEAVVGVRKLF